MAELAFSREIITPAFLEEAEPLFTANQAETGAHPGAMGVDKEGYRVLQECGWLRLFVGRNAEGHLGAYNTMIVRPHPHSGVITAHQDALFAMPRYRQGFAGLRLMAFADESLAREGVKSVVRQSSTRRDIGPLLGRMGYIEIERTYLRSLSHGS